MIICICQQCWGFVTHICRFTLPTVNPCSVLSHGSSLQSRAIKINASFLT